MGQRSQRLVARTSYPATMAYYRRMTLGRSTRFVQPTICQCNGTRKCTSQTSGRTQIGMRRPQHTHHRIQATGTSRRIRYQPRVGTARLYQCPTRRHVRPHHEGAETTKLRRLEACGNRATEALHTYEEPSRQVQNTATTTTSQ
jgi:hypothetical protein